MNVEKITYRGKKVVVGLMWFFSGSVMADSFCFLIAQNYYEQVYCELKAMGRSDQLPALYDFRNNDELTQALLLKQPARKAGIDFKMPRRTPDKPARQHIARQHNSEQREYSPVGPGVAGPEGILSGCSLADAIIRCGNRSYAFITNRRNNAISNEVFLPSFTMGLPPFGGSVENSGEVARYLGIAYPIYLEKMVALGLGESTMTYGKFAAIFYDVTQKGVNFSDRFETMYRFLKKDKQSMAVRISDSVPLNLSLGGCELINNRMVSCVHQGKNFLFVGQGS